MVERIAVATWLRLPDCHLRKLLEQGEDIEAPTARLMGTFWLPSATDPARDASPILIPWLKSAHHDLPTPTYSVVRRSATDGAIVATDLLCQRNVLESTVHLSLARPVNEHHVLVAHLDLLEVPSDAQGDFLTRDKIFDPKPALLVGDTDRVGYARVSEDDSRFGDRLAVFVDHLPCNDAGRLAQPHV